MITVKLTGQFKDLAPADSENGEFSIDWAADTTPTDLITRLNVDSKGLNYTVLINNSRKQKDYVIEDGDYVIVMPLLMGG